MFVDIESYKDEVLAKIDAMSEEDLRMIFSEVLDGYEKPIPLMAIPIVVLSFSIERTFILIFRRCRMYRKRGKLSEIRRTKRK
jgi:hypothetical protein